MLRLALEPTRRMNRQWWARSIRGEPYWIRPPRRIWMGRPQDRGLGPLRRTMIRWTVSSFRGWITCPFLRSLLGFWPQYLSLTCMRRTTRIWRRRLRGKCWRASIIVVVSMVVLHRRSSSRGRDFSKHQMHLLRVSSWQKWRVLPTMAAP